ncbi:hypothetical protein AM349_09955 [Citrobacter freundii]|uniref:hypothetical protein n=1 Tax=Citrobacter freundii TaxID=546 RepID=UPI000C21FC57|nr:hypothetical protein [Citrobacter freundii]ATX96391.1 hypothetical protein AM349_09955 [Citrobacter freundii]
MGSNIIELAKLGHERAAELKASCGAVDVRSLAQLISDLATQLEVQLTRGNAQAVQLANAESKCGELAAESAGLKSGQSFFMCSDETGFEIHKAQDAAIASAKDMIAVCREDAAQDGWPEDADTICWGVIMQKAIEMDFEKPSEQNGWIGWSEYKLSPDIETPATDAFMAEVRAQGVEMAMEHMQSSGSLTFGDCYISLNEFAAQLRKGVRS